MTLSHDPTVIAALGDAIILGTGDRNVQPSAEGRDQVTCLQA